MNNLQPPPAFQPGENFERWLRGVEHYLVAVDITSAERKAAVMLTLLGLEVQEIVRTLPRPTGLSRDVDEFKVLTEKLKSYYQPQVNVTYEKALLHDIQRKEGETFEGFVTRLRLQADRCQYDTAGCEAVVLECAVARCRDKDMQKKFFSDPQLTLLKALEVARHIEMMRSQLEDLNRPAPLHFVSGNKSPGVSSPCFRCNSVQHQASACPFKLQQCFACSRVGHTRSACRSTCQPSQPQQRNQPKSSRSSQVRSGKTQQSRQQRELPQSRCSRCHGASHVQSSCPFKGATCYACQRVGHTQAACRNRVSQPSHRAQYVEESDQPIGVHEVYDLYRLDECLPASPPSHAASPFCPAASMPSSAASLPSSAASQPSSAASQPSPAASPPSFAASLPSPLSSAVSSTSPAASSTSPATALPGQPSPAVCQPSPAVCQPSPAVCQPSPAVGQPSPGDSQLSSLVSPPSPTASQPGPVACQPAEEQVFHLSPPSHKPIIVDVSIDQVPLTMEVDTGASCSIISQEVFENMWPDRSARPPLKESSRRLLTYMRDEVPLAGVANVSVTYGDQSAQLPLLVVKQPGPALLGRDWLQAIRLDWPSLFLMSSGGPDPLPSSAHSLSDSLKQLVSEFPEAHACPESTPLPADVVQMMDAVGSLVSVPLIQTATRRDPVISAAYIYTRDGWPAKCPKDDLSVLFSHRSELSIDSGCLLWGLRVVIPHVLRSRVLSMLHDGHPGMTAMKQLARGVVWWPGLDGQIEDCVRACQVCQSERGKVPDVPLSPWIFPNEPWKRIHVDFAGPVKGKFCWSSWMRIPSGWMYISQAAPHLSV